MLKKTTTENSNPLCPVLKPFQEPVFKEKSSDKTLSFYSLDEKPLVTFNVTNTNCINESLPNLIIKPQFGIKSLTSHLDKSLVTLTPLNVTIPNTIIDLRPEQRIFVEGNIKHNPLSYTKENFIDKIVQNDKGISLQMPIILDAEWFDQNDIEKILNGGIKGNVEHYIKPRTGLTVQMKTWGKNNEKIFTTPFLHNHLIKNGHNIRHDVLKSPLVIIDQMKSLGIPASVRRIERYDEDKKNKLAKIPNKLIIPFYLYFGVADYGFIANDDDYRKDLKSFYANKKGRTITFDKHLSSKYVGDDNSCETPFKTNWIININGTEFVVWLKFIDLVAMLGNRGLDSAFQIAGVEQKKEKDLIRDYEKSNMLGVYIDKPYEFDKYAGIADLQLDVLIDKIINLDNKIYDDFKLDYLPDAYKQPSKTIGSSVVNLFNAILTEKILGAECQNVKPQNLEYLTSLEEKTPLKDLTLKEYKKVQNNIFEVLTKDASAESLLKYINQDFTFLLAKVQAGRCRNNKPSFFSSTFLSYDIDISGCYNRGMGILDYPLGTPIIFTCKTSKKKEKIISNEKIKTKKGSYNKIRYRFEVNKPVVSLETLINHFNLDDAEKCQLVDNLWFFNITTMENLNYFQSLIPSFYDTTYEKYKSRKMDVCSKQGDLDFNSGTITILGHEIINGVLTSELLRTIKQNNSAKIYQDFIKKVGVTAGVFYPKNLKCENVDQVIEKRILKDKNCNKKKKRDFDINIEGVQIVNENDCHAWTSYNLGNLIIDKLRFFRNQYDKGTPENEFYKLISNTIYGDQVSRFFITSNIVVANNITATVRSYMWLLENSLFLNGSITDGDVGFFHEALYPTNDKYFNTAKLHIADYEKNHTLQANDICQKKPLIKVVYNETNKEIIINDKNYDNKREVDQIVLERINEHIIEYGKLSNMDFSLINKCRGEHNKLGFAYQLIFIKLLNTAPCQSPFEIIEEIVIYAGMQLSLDSTIICLYLNRQKISAHQKTIITYLQYNAFNEQTQMLLKDFIFQQALQFEPISLLQIKSVEFLRDLKMLLPAEDTLLRIIRTQRSSARKLLFDKIHMCLSPDIINKLDVLLEVIAYYSPIENLKSPVKNASPDTILNLVERSECIIATGALQIDLSHVNNNYKRTLANEVKRCSADRIKKMEPTRRYTALICFLKEAYQNNIDLLISSYIKLMNAAHTRANNQVDKEFKQNEAMIRESLANYEEIKGVIRDITIPDSQLRLVLYERFPDELERDLPEIHTLLNGKKTQVFKAFTNKYSYFRQFTPRLFSLLALQHESKNTKSNTLQALNVLNKLNEDNKRTLPDNVPLEFIPKQLKKLVINSKKNIERHTWECALYLKIRDEIKQGNINAPDSKLFSSIKSFLIADDEMALIGEEFFKRSKFPKDRSQVREYFTKRLAMAYEGYFNREPDNDYAKVVNGKWVLGTDPAEVLLPDRKKELDAMKAWLNKRMHPIKLPELLIEADNDIHFTETLMLRGKDGAASIDAIFGVLATLMAHGCNIGAYTMSKLIDGITYKEISRITDWQLTNDAMRVALSRIINAMSKLGITKKWGSGKTSSSDAHLKTFNQKVAQQSYQARIGDFALAFYTFVADNYAPFHSKPFDCAEGEAPHALDGFLYNESDLPLEEHYTDTRAAATILFSSFGWYGQKYSPRIRGIKNHHIYMIDPEMDYGNLSPLLKHKTAKINLSYIENSWEEMAQFYASIEQGKVTASVAIRRLLSLSKKNVFYKANLHLGRILKTEHILAHMSDKEYRKSKHRGLLSLSVKTLNF